VMGVLDRGRGIGRHRPARPDRMASGGRGLFIIRRLMARTESRRTRGGHLLRMVYAGGVRMEGR